MKIRGIVTTTVLVLAIIAVSTTTAAALSCSDGDICVNQSGWWRGGGTWNASGAPIQAAVNNATAGETIYVWNGSYSENVDIATSHLTLRGEGADAVTVTAADQGDHVFDVTADYVNISGFTATGATESGKAGVRLGSKQHCNISENNCSGNHFGIWLSASSDNNMLLSNNCSDNDKFGIHLPSSSNNTLAGNTANSNDEYGIYLYHSSNNTLLGNTANLNNEDGIYLSYSSNNTLTSNTANSNSYHYGIGLYRSSNNTLAGNTASNNSYGIRLCASSNNTLTGNNASNNYCGIYLWSSSNNNTLLGNTANSNPFDGIYLEHSSNNTLAGNTANSNNRCGIHLYDADDNNITCNWVHNNTDAGFYLKIGSTGNTIERNNIIANGNYNDASGGWEWQFKNDQPDDVCTAGNWWGTDNETRINASIRDWTYWTSGMGWGNVTTNPKLDGTVPCAPIPELSTVVLLAVGLLMLVGCARIGRKT